MELVPELFGPPFHLDAEPDFGRVARAVFSDRRALKGATSIMMIGVMKRRLATLLLAWLAAFLIVMVLYLTLGPTLEQFPTWLRALFVSGVLVISMTQVVMPGIQRSLSRDRRR